MLPCQLHLYLRLGFIGTHHVMSPNKTKTQIFVLFLILCFQGKLHRLYLSSVLQTIAQKDNMKKSILIPFQLLVCVPDLLVKYQDSDGQLQR